MGRQYEASPATGAAPEMTQARHTPRMVSERDLVWKSSFSAPSDRRDLPNMTIEFVQLGELTLARATAQPGWHWSKDIKPVVGTDQCMVHHRGLIISGGLGIEYPNGQRVDYLVGDVYDITPGHDGWTIGDEPVVMVDMSNQMSEFGQPSSGERVLTTLVFTDIVGSTEIAGKMGDRAWKVLLGQHDYVLRNEIERYRGRIVTTTGDGLLARFDGAARALEAGVAICEAAEKLGLRVRVGVHTGEVELVTSDPSSDLRGIAVHEAARIMALAGPSEVLTSELTRQLAIGSTLRFEDRGEVELRGVSGSRRLFAVAR